MTNIKLKTATNLFIEISTGNVSRSTSIHHNAGR